MNWLKRRLIALPVLALFARPALAASAERVYVYAQTDTAARSWLPVTCDSTAVARLKRGYFFAVQLPAGRHTLSMPDGVPVTIDLQPGRDAYVQLNWSHTAGRPPIAVFSPISPESACRHLRNLSYIPAKQIISTLVPATAVVPEGPTEFHRRP